MPCFKLGMRMGDAAFVDRFGASCRPGAYLRIVDAGELAAGDPISVGEVPGHGLTVLDIARAERDAPRDALERLIAIGDVPVMWRDWARRQLGRA
jgi:MOSC domain-containing protein YiiM